MALEELPAVRRFDNVCGLACCGRHANHLEYLVEREVGCNQGYLEVPWNNSDCYRFTCLVRSPRGLQRAFDGLPIIYHSI